MAIHTAPCETIRKHLFQAVFYFAGITPYANLYHYDLPEALEKKYLGLLGDQVV